MSKQSPFDKLFPQDLLQIASTILKLKRSYDNSISILLSNNAYFKQCKHIYVNPVKNIILFYKKGDSNKKRPEAFNELLRVAEMYNYSGHPPLQLIYGYLASCDGVIGEESPVVMYNAVIKIMSGESLLRYLFSDSYDSIISNISDEIKRHFPALTCTPTESFPNTLNE